MPSWPVAVYPAALLLALVLPFEAIQPVLVTPWMSLTDEKVVLGLAPWVCARGRRTPSGGRCCLR